MSHPKSGPIRVTRYDRKQEAERRRRQKERQAKEEHAAEKRRMQRREEARQHAAEVAAERAERRLEIEKRQEEARQRAEQDRLRRRSETAHKMADQVRQEATRLVDVYTGMPPQIKESIHLAPPTLTAAPTDKKDIQALELWCTENRRLLSVFSQTLRQQASNASVTVGKQALVQALSAGIDFEIPSAAPLIAAFQAKSRAQNDANMQREIDRVISMLKSGAAIFESPALSSAMRESLRVNLDSVSGAQDLLQLKSQADNCIAFFAAAQAEVSTQIELSSRLKKILQDWEELGETVPEELRTSADDAVNLTETQVQEWEHKFNDVKTATEAEHQKILQQQREADRELIATALQQTLENLGYEVDTIKHSMFVEGGRFYATRPEWKGHFVEISGTVEGDDDRLKSRCVRTPQADASLNEQVDCRWVKDIHESIKQLKDDGIKLEVDRIDKTAPLVATLTAQEISAHPRLRPARQKQASHTASQAMPIPRKE